MNTNELLQFLKQIDAMGFTLAEAEKICILNRWNTNNEKLNGINKMFCEGWNIAEMVVR